MALLAVNSVKLGRSVNFQGKYDKDENVEIKNERLSNGMSKAAVPVVVLMTLNPSLLNAKALNLPVEEPEPDRIEASVPDYEEGIDEMTYVMKPELLEEIQTQDNPPYGWRMFNTEKIRMSRPAKGDGKPYTLVYTSYKADKPEDVRSVYLVEKGKKGSPRPIEHPPEVKELIVHDLGPGKEFCGVRTCEYVITANGENDGIIWREIKLDDDTAQQIIDLLVNYSKWNNRTNIKSSTTKSAELIPPQHYH